MTHGNVRIRSGVIRGRHHRGARRDTGACSDLPRTSWRGCSATPRLLVSGPRSPGGPAGGRPAHFTSCRPRLTMLGRGTDGDLRLFWIGRSEPCGDKGGRKRRSCVVTEFHQRPFVKRPAGPTGGASPDWDASVRWAGPRWSFHRTARDEAGHRYSRHTY